MKQWMKLSTTTTDEGFPYVGIIHAHSVKPVPLTLLALDPIYWHVFWEPLLLVCWQQVLQTDTAVIDWYLLDSSPAGLVLADCFPDVWSSYLPPGNQAMDIVARLPGLLEACRYRILAPAKKAHS